MKIKELLYKTPEMTEEKLLELIDKHKGILREPLKSKFYNSEDILKEWDLIQDKASYLTRGQRDQICTLVSYCLMQMISDDGRGEES